MKEYLDVSAVAKMIGTNYHRLYMAVRLGRIQADCKIGGSYGFDHKKIATVKEAFELTQKKEGA